MTDALETTSTDAPEAAPMTPEPRPPADDDADPDRAPSTFARLAARVLALLLAVAVLGAGVGVAVYWLANRPKASRRPPAAAATLVEVEVLAAGPHRVTVEAMGTVAPARRIALAARVGGEVVEVADAFTPGGLLAEGETVLQLDPEDYEIAVARAELALERAKLAARQRESDIAARQSELAKAQEAMKIELGRQAVAKREYELLGEDIDDADRELVLRRPQLASARAGVAAAEAAVDSARAARDAAEQAVKDAENTLRAAKLDLSRTIVTAPFNGAILDRNVERGSQVSPGTALATFAGTDEYWIRVLVPVDQLRWIEMPAAGLEGSSVRIYHEPRWGPGVHRAGRVLKLLPDIEPRGRMAQLLVAVDDPLGLRSAEVADAPLLLDAYVTVAIQGQQVASVIPVPRSALHDGRHVWVAGNDGQLDVREVRMIWRGKETVYVAEGLADGERLIVSDLAAAVDGMPVRTAGEAAPATAPAGEARR